MTRLLIGFALVSALTATGAPAAPVAPPPREVAYYFPTTVGTRCVYVGHTTYDGTSQGSREWEEIVREVVPRTGGAFNVRVAISQAGEPVSSFAVEVRPGGLAPVADGDGTAPPLPRLLRLPHRAGAKWSATQKLGTEEVHWAVTDGGPEWTVLPTGGRLPAVRVEAGATYKGVRYQVTSWYTAGVGLVRRMDVRQRHVFETVLKSFIPGKD